MNAVGFYLLAVLIVVAAATAVTLPRLRDAAGAAVASMLLVAIVAGASGEYLVAVAEVLAPLAGVAAVVWVLRRRGYRGLAATGPRVPRRWRLGAAVSLGLGTLLVTVVVLSAGNLAHGSGSTSPPTVLGSREPYALVIAVVLLASAIAIALLLGRTADDERRADARREARMTRDERMRLRREAREAARRAKREAPAAGGGA